MEPLASCQRSDTVDVLYIAKKSLLEIACYEKSRGKMKILR